MIAADTSTLISYMGDEGGADTEMLDNYLNQRQVVISPIVLTETLCDPGLSPAQSLWLKDMVLLDIEDGFWERAAETRKKLLVRRLKAKTPDTLIAQSCIDHDLPLLTRDPDFGYFSKYCTLKLVIPA